VNTGIDTLSRRPKNPGYGNSAVARIVSVGSNAAARCRSSNILLEGPQVANAYAREVRATKKHFAKIGKSAGAPVGAESREISIDSIDWSEAVRGIDPEHARRLASAATLPPVVVWEFEKGKFRGIDGFHRWQVAKARGSRTLGVVIRRYAAGPEGQKRFEFDCVQMNIKHGLPLTRDQRDRAITRLWNRWGRSSKRLDGMTLDEIAHTFNLTKQRIHQVIVSNATSQPATGNAELAAAPVTLEESPRPGAGPQVMKGSRGRATGFSTLGRFTAATKRLSTVLSDVQFVRQLIQSHQVEVRELLLDLRALLDTFLVPDSERGVSTQAASLGLQDRHPSSLTFGNRNK
jgi:hypothetical protein